MWSSLKNYSDPALLFARVVLGLLVLCFTAWPKLQEAMALWSHHGHHPFWMSLLYTALALAETLGAIFLIIGFWTRPSALLFAIIVALPLFRELQGHGGIAGARHFIELLLLFIIFFFVGPGRFSFDKA